jgi:ABC-type nitrate/sulfonate/bicarbonate transport system permease component
MAGPEPGSRRRARLLAVVGTVAVFVVWEGVVRAAYGGHRVVPAPSVVLAELWDDRDLYPRNIETTGREAFLGFVYGNAVAIAIGATALLSSVLGAVMLRVALVIRTMPFLAIAPVLQVVLEGESAKVAVAALLAFFPTLIGTLVGLRSADPLAVELVRGLGGSRLKVLHKIRIQSAMPSILAGLRIAVPASVLGAVAGEFLGGERGLGIMMIQALETANVVRLWGVAVVSAAMACLAYMAVSLLGKVATPWAG